MRLLTHNTLRNNSADAQRAARKRAKEAGGLGAAGAGGGRGGGVNGVYGGYPLKITATEIRVDDSGGDADGGGEEGDEADREIRFVRGVLGALDWAALVEAATSMGISTLPPELTEDLASDDAFLRALYHVLMNVHLVRGVLTCPDTGREFPVTDGVPNMITEEEECERVRL